MLKDLFSKLGGEIVVGTHDGEFHADEVFSVAALMMVKPITVVRSRDPEKLATCNVLVDVGGEYDPEKCKFDHHQQGGAGPRSNGVKYSSFGLVWKEIGEILAPGYAHLVDRDLVQGIDAMDNGQGSVNVFQNSDKEYCEHVTVSSMIGNMNPTWQELRLDRELDRGGTTRARFDGAVVHATDILCRAIAVAYAEMAALKLIETVNGWKIRILCEKGIDGGAMVKALSDYDSEAHFLVFLASNGEWSVQAVPPNRKDQFGQRTRFPEAWNWKRGEDLALVSGVEDAIFCHGFGFFACAKSEEGAIKLAEKALDLSEK